MAGSYPPVLKLGAPVREANPLLAVLFSFSSALLSKSLRCYLLFYEKISPPPPFLPSVAAVPPAALFASAFAVVDGPGTFGFIYPTR